MYSENESTPLFPPINTCRLEELGVSIRDYVDLLLENRKTILLTLLAVLGVTMVYLVIVPRTYKANVVLRIDKNNKVLVAAAFGSEANDAPTEVDNPQSQRELEILRSRSVLSRVVEDLSLMVEYSPHYFPIIGETLARRYDAHDGIATPWWGFGRWAWGGEKLKIATFNVPNRYLDKAFTLIALDESRFRLLGPKNEFLAEGQVGDSITAGMGKNEPVVIKLAELAAHPGTHFELTRKTSLAAIETLQKAFSVKEVSKNNRDTHVCCRRGIARLYSSERSFCRAVRDRASGLRSVAPRRRLLIRAGGPGA